MKSDSWIGIDYKFTFNLPANTLEEVQMASQLEGVVSNETKLSVLSFVDDVKSEIEKMKQEDIDNAVSIVDKRMFEGLDDEQL